jgi:hypothetical protein
VTERGALLDAPLTRAARFVAQQAGELERVYCETLLRALPAQALLAALAKQQRADGAFAPWRPRDASPEAAARRALTWLGALGITDHPLCEAAVAYLAAQAAPDGGFGPAALPPELRVAITGESAGLLARTPFARASLLRRAERFLARAYSPDLLQSGEYAPLLAYGHALTRIDSELADEALVWCGRELEKGWRGGRFTALQLARVLLRAGVRGLPGAQLDPGEIALSLLASQERDGGWPAEPGADRVDATLEAIEALLRLAPPASSSGPRAGA